MTQVLTSGLDDSTPRVPPHAGELHVDLASWMGFFARTMRDVAEFLGEEDDVDDFGEQYDAIVGNIDGAAIALLRVAIPIEDKR